MSIFQTLKSTADILLEANKIEQYKQILEVQSQLLEMQEDINNLKSENRELKEKLINKEKLTPNRNSYWIKEEDKNDGPYCTGCWDGVNKLVRLNFSGQGVSGVCPVCKTSVEVYPEKALFRKMSSSATNPWE